MKGAVRMGCPGEDQAVDMRQLLADCVDAFARAISSRCHGAWPLVRFGIFARGGFPFRPDPPDSQIRFVARETSLYLSIVPAKDQFDLWHGESRFRYLKNEAYRL